MQPKYFKAWVIFTLIATIGGFILGALTGMILGAILGIAGVEPTIIKIACAIAGFFVGLPLSYFAFRWCVSEFIIKEMKQAIQASPSLPSKPASNPKA